jgi:hypothetical protein
LNRLEESDALRDIAAGVVKDRARRAIVTGKWS